MLSLASLLLHGHGELTGYSCHPLLYQCNWSNISECPILAPDNFLQPWYHCRSVWILHWWGVVRFFLRGRLSVESRCIRRDKKFLGDFYISRLKENGMSELGLEPTSGGVELEGRKGMAITGSAEGTSFISETLEEDKSERLVEVRVCRIGRNTLGTIWHWGSGIFHLLLCWSQWLADSMMEHWVIIWNVTLLSFEISADVGME